MYKKKETEYIKNKQQNVNSFYLHFILCAFTRFDSDLSHHLRFETALHPPYIIISRRRNSHNNFRNDSEQYRDYETVFIIPGPSQMKNRKT